MACRGLKMVLLYEYPGDVILRDMVSDMAVMG